MGHKGFTPIVVLVLIALLVGAVVLGFFLLDRESVTTLPNKFTTNEPKMTIPAPKPNISFLYTKDGNIWLATQDNKTGTQITNEEHLNNPSFSPDGNYVQYFDKNEQLWLLKLSSKEKRLVLGKPIYTALWSPDSKTIALSTAIFPREPGPSSPTNNDLYIYDVSTGNVAQIFGANEGGALGGLNVVWSPSSKFLAYATTGEVGIVNLALQKSVSQTFEHVSIPSEISFSPSIQWSFDGETLYFSLPDKPDIMERQWSLYSGKFNQKAAFVKKVNSTQSENYIFSPTVNRVLIVANNYVSGGLPGDTIYDSTISVADNTGENPKELFHLKSKSTYYTRWTDIPNKVLIVGGSSQFGNPPTSFLVDITTNQKINLPYPPEDPQNIKSGAYFTKQTEFSGQYYTTYYLIYGNYTQTEKLYSAPDVSPDTWFFGKIL